MSFTVPQPRVPNDPVGAVIALTFGGYVRHLRARRGVSAAGLARQMGFTSPYVINVEKGRQRPFKEEHWSPLLSLGADEQRLRWLAQHWEPPDEGTEPRVHPRRWRIPPGRPGSWTWDTLSWEQDDWAQDVVDNQPQGLSIDEVAALMGLSRERVRQIETVALRRLKRRAEVADMMDTVRSLASERDLATIRTLAANVRLNGGRDNVG